MRPWVKQNLHTYEERRDYFRERVAKALGMSVSLVGAGPGDPELITVRGLARVRDVRGARLRPARRGRDRRARRRSARCASRATASSQDDINELLVAHGRRGRRVVRLKGGDPFVFGRGGEEALALVRAGVPFELVPGVSSIAAVPESAGIPGHASRRLADGDGVRRERRRAARRARRSRGSRGRSSRSWAAPSSGGSPSG